MLLWAKLHDLTLCHFRGLFMIAIKESVISILLDSFISCHVYSHFCISNCLKATNFVVHVNLIHNSTSSTCCRPEHYVNIIILWHEYTILWSSFQQLQNIASFLPSKGPMEVKWKRTVRLKPTLGHQVIRESCVFLWFWLISFLLGWRWLL